MTNYKEEIKKCLNDLKSRETFYKQIPNLITSFRIIGVIPMNILYFMGHIPAAVVVASIIFLTDFLDGMIARKFNITSSFGADLDAISDKVFSLGLCIPLMISNPILILNIVLELMIGTVNTISKLKGYEPKSNFVGKLKTWILSLTILVGYLNNIINIPSIIFQFSTLGTALFQGVALGGYINSYKKNKNDNEIIKSDLCYENNSYEENIKYEIDKIEYLKRERERLLEMNLPDKNDINTKKRKRTYTNKRL